VLVDEGKSDGCGACLEACLYDAPTLAPEKNVVFKCTLCSHRIDEGDEPFCVKCCEAEAIFFGDLNDPKKPSLTTDQAKRCLYPET